MGMYGTFKHKGIPVRDQLATTGNTFYVSSTGGIDIPEHGGNPNAPFASIDYAIGKCTANKGDVIYVMPGHVENVAAAGAIALDVAGVSIVGLGRGSLRPILSLTAAAASITISAASCQVKNIIFNANFADVATCFTVSAVDARIEGNLFKEAGTDLNWLSCVVTSATNNACDGLEVIGNERNSIDAAALAFVSILGNITGLNVSDNIDTQSSAADVGHFIIMSSKVCLNTKILRNILNLNGDNNAQTVGVFATGSSTTSTGVMAHNLVGSLDTTTELIVTATLDFQMFQNFYTGVLQASGKLWPAVDLA